MRKFIGLLAVMGLALLSLAGMASASSNLPNGTVLNATGTEVDLGGLITCHSNVRATMTNAAAGRGIHASITAASFTPCTQSGASAAPTTLPWTLDLAGTDGGGSIWTGLATDVNVDVIILGLHCRYTGNVGATYSNAAMNLTLSGNLATTDTFCPTPEPVRGVYHVSPTLTIS